MENLDGKNVNFDPNGDFNDYPVVKESYKKTTAKIAEQKKQ